LGLTAVTDAPVWVNNTTKKRQKGTLGAYLMLWSSKQIIKTSQESFS
jgi:hypothetical protein